MTINPNLFPHTGVIVRPVEAADAYNDQTLDYSGGVRTTVPCRFIQRSSSEPYAEGRDADLETWDVLLNVEDIRSTDRIEWADHPRGAVVFEVHGPPIPRYSGQTFHHTKAPLRIYEG